MKYGVGIVVLVTRLLYRCIRSCDISL